MTLTIGWPQGVTIALLFAHVGLHLFKHGLPFKEGYNAGMALFRAGSWVAVLTWGGFFS